MSEMVKWIKNWMNLIDNEAWYYIYCMKKVIEGDPKDWSK